MKEPPMTEGTEGLVGDRRKNPFPSMTETEYRLFLATIRECVQTGVANAMKDYRTENCLGHQERTERVETAVFGRRELGIVGMDETIDKQGREIDAMRDEMKALAEDRKWFKRLVIGAIVIASIGLVFGIIQAVAVFAATGN